MIFYDVKNGLRMNILSERQLEVNCSNEKFIMRLNKELWI